MFLNKIIGDTMQLTVLRGTQTLAMDVTFSALTG
jgi:hypothetical protein